MASLQDRYARALFELAIERGLTSDYLQQAAFIGEVLSDDQTKLVLTHPRIAMADKHAFLDNAFKGRIHDDLLGFMRLTVTKNREEYIADAFEGLVKLIRHHQNFTSATVVSAVALAPEQESRLKVSLMRKLGKQIELNTEVDPSLIGGFRLHVDGHVFDQTLKRMLKDMKESIGKGRAS